MRRSPEPIIAPVPRAQLERDVAALPPESLLCEQGPFAVYVAPAYALAAVLTELGRLRELAFRSAGEGTGHALDLDVFDGWYEHLFVWHRDSAAVVGAYRLGRLDTILPTYGPDGLYTTTLFGYAPDLLAELGDAVELGRSFVRLDAQRSTFALPLLWRGIGRWLAARPHLRRLLGPVSIDARYTPASVGRIVGHLRAHHMDPGLAARVRPHAPWVPATSAVARACAEGALLPDLPALGRAVEADEHDDRSIPVLLRQYLKLGGTVLGANVDAAFADVVDALVLVDLDRVDPARLTKFMGPDGAAAFRAARRCALRVVA